MHKRVFVGLSGGVDSAVSAALLKRDGYDVTGVFIKIWRPTFFECTWEKDRLDAMRVAVALGIPFLEVDLSEDYEREVIREMIDSYTNGITPNPDVTCNEKIKFGTFYAWARAQGADYVATGHYARITSGEHPVLMRGADPEKDQSYFLYRIPKGALSHILFPVGSLTKSAVRALARSFELPVAQKGDSQGLCFVGDVRMQDFLARYIAVKDGDVLDMSGNVIGRHSGAALYTVGQRHGFSIQSSTQHYVARINAASNVIHVSPRISDCASSGVDLLHEHWLADIRDIRSVTAQSRYRERMFSAELIRADDGSLRARFKEPHVVSPGQSFVVYDNDTCLGGAKIGATVHSSM